MSNLWLSVGEEKSAVNDITIFRVICRTPELQRQSDRSLMGLSPLSCDARRKVERELGWVARHRINFKWGHAGV